MTKPQAPTINALRQRLRDLRSVLIAFSGGCDSTLLAVVAAEELGNNALAVTVRSTFMAEEEIKRTGKLAEKFGIRHRIISADVLSISEVRENPPDRCYHCKNMIFETLTKIARDEGLEAVCDGTNLDDHSDYRPGRRALKERGVVSPFEDCGFRKADIRRVSKEMGIPTWSLPAAACLASRIPHGEELSDSKLRQVERAEAALADLGYTAFRVRHHGDLARVELEPGQIAQSVKDRQRISHALHQCGYRYVTLDLDGYRTGSMNPTMSSDRY